jgi:hypothetical protein
MLTHPSTDALNFGAQTLASRRATYFTKFLRDAQTRALRGSGRGKIGPQSLTRVLVTDNGVAPCTVANPEGAMPNA